MMGQGMYFVKKILSGLIFCTFLCVSAPAFAASSIVDVLDFSVFVPIVLDALLTVATGVYKFFVEGGILYTFIWVFFGISVALYLTKMFFPKSWIGFFGMSGGGELFEGKITADKIVDGVAKTGVRALIASLVLLSFGPLFMTKWLVNPFLELGAVYTTEIIKISNIPGVSGVDAMCDEHTAISPDSVSVDTCRFLVQPVYDLSHANNQIIKRGFEFVMRGLRGLMVLIPNGGQDFMNLLTGIVLVFTFVSCNLFMALLIIQGIFAFGVQLILYPFNVMTYVFKPSDKWLDLMPAFGGLVKALQQLIITMIACAFIFCINVVAIKSLLNWRTSVFVSAAGGSAYGNVSGIAQSSMSGFGTHSITWISAILTFFLMFKIFDMTRKQLMEYVGKDADALYNKTMSDIGAVQDRMKSVKKIKGFFSKK